MVSFPRNQLLQHKALPWASKGTSTQITRPIYFLTTYPPLTMGLSRHNFLPCIVLVLVSSLLLVNAQAPTPTPSADSAGTARPQPSCGFNGDDNAYGAGIRIGLYIQWITSAIAYNFVPEEASNMRVVNICFQLANFAGLLYITFSRGVGQPSGELYAVECWILLCFCIGGICSSRSRASNSNGELSQTNNFSLYKATALGGLIQLALGAAMVYYGIWFVYVGMDTMQHTSCSRYAFFFSRVVSAETRFAFWLL
jgi:hypothetical protein